MPPTPRVSIAAPPVPDTLAYLRRPAPIPAAAVPAGKPAWLTIEHAADTLETIRQRADELLGRVQAGLAGGDENANTDPNAPDAATAGDRARTEHLAAVLNTLHNLTFYLDMMHKIREAIALDSYGSWLDLAEKGYA